MMVKRLCLSILTLSFTFGISKSLAATDQGQQRYNSLFVRHELFQTKYRPLYKVMSDISQREALESWYGLFFRTRRHQHLYETHSRKLGETIQSKRYRDLLIYYTLTNQHQLAKELVGLYFFSAHILLDHFVHNPSSAAWAKSRRIRLRSSLDPNLILDHVEDMESCVLNNRQRSSRQQFSLGALKALVTDLGVCYASDDWAMDLLADLRTVFIKHAFYGAPFPVNFSGPTKGNIVTLLTEVPLDFTSIITLGDQLHLLKTASMPKTGQKYSTMSIDDFKAAMPSPESAVNDFFTTEQGFLSAPQHPYFAETVNDDIGIFGTILKSLQEAKESAFVDIFWLGGSIGMRVAQTLMQKVIDNPEFQVHLLIDRENTFGYGEELTVVYNYMRAFSEKFTHTHFYVTPSELNLKRTALPEFFDLLITDDIIDDVQSQELFKNFFDQDGIHLLGKSDHSKTVVVDGKNPKLGKAFVGSKNWTDSSGSIATDEVAQIQGPAVAMILDAHYYDAMEAFLSDMHGGGDMVEAHLGNVNFQDIADNYKVQSLLIGMDVMDRYKTSELRDTHIPYEPREDGQVVDLAQNNVYGTEISVVDQYVQAILGAKHQIIIDDQHFYDANIFEAVKVARQKHGVDVYVMLHPLTSALDNKLYGAFFRNRVFIPELRTMGIPVKWKILPEDVSKAVIQIYETTGNEVSPEFHLKSLSVDGVLAANRDQCQTDKIHLGDGSGGAGLITGSANKDVLTLSGGFREFQIMAFDDSAVYAHDCKFWERWDDPLATEWTDGLDFDLPPSAKSVGIQTKVEFINYMRQITFSIYNFLKFSAE